MREKQLAAMRIDICSSDALKRLKGARSLSLLQRADGSCFRDQSRPFFFPRGKLILASLNLADKAGGKKFSKDFEEGSAQLQEFVKFFDKQILTGPPVMEALKNADIFYEMQYKEVKIVANVSLFVFVVLFNLPRQCNRE